MENKKYFFVLLVGIISLLSNSTISASEITGYLFTGIYGTVLATPVANPVAGIYASVQNVVLTANGSTSIHYTINESIPTCSTGITISSGDVIFISLSQTITAISCYQDNRFSSIATFSYEINPVLVGGGSGLNPIPPVIPPVISPVIPPVIPTPVSIPASPSASATILPQFSIPSATPILALTPSINQGITPSNIVTLSPEITITPTELFDIILTIENALLNKSSDLIARTQFTSFGTVPTPVDMVYRVEDASGLQVYSENNEVTVETEQLVTKDFKNLNIGDGKYTLVLTTTYGANVTDEFRQAFEVKKILFSKENLVTVICFVSILFVVGMVGKRILIRH